ncbi:MAG: hypothetical protein FJX23_00230 [Alphaproteobacteria bacterium]|nr:hypothetical protein [Alphaproteobacteria bacterium]
MPITPIDEMLDNLREGKSDALHHSGLIDPITFYEIIESVKEAPKVEKLRFSASGFDKDDVEQLLEAVATRPELKELELSDAPFDRKGALQLVNALSNVKGLHVLRLNNCQMKDEAMQPLVEWIATQKNLRSIEIRGNEWHQSTHDRLAWAIRDNTSLVRMDIRPQGERLDNHAFETALLHKPHPNFFMSDIKSGPIFNLIGHNHRYMTLTETFIQNKVHGAKMDYAAIAQRIKPESLFNAESHRDVVAYRQQNTPDYMRAYDDFLEQMPKLPEDKPVSLAALMQPDAEGLTPLENPLVWKQHPKLLAELAAKGELTDAALKQETPKGTTLLEAAVAYRPLPETLQVMNKQGLHMRLHRLIDGSGQHTRLMETVMMKGETSALFAADNWKGASPKEPPQLRNALSDKAQLQVPPLNALIQQMRLSQRDRTQAGIGR